MCYQEELNALQGLENIEQGYKEAITVGKYEALVGCHSNSRRFCLNPILVFFGRKIMLGMAVLRNFPRSG